MWPSAARPVIATTTTAVALCLAATAVPAAHAAGITVTAEAAGVQQSTVSGVITANFDAFTPGAYTSLTTAVGTYTAISNLSVVPADAFGGAGGTRYLTLSGGGSQRMATLTFPAPQSYFGFHWSAGDSTDVLEFWHGGARIATFTPGSITALLDPYKNKNSPGHFGNPDNPDQNTTEPYAYLNFFGIDGLQFDAVRFFEGGNNGFESDNHSVRVAPVTGTLPGRPLTTLAAAAVPEPGSVALLGAVASLLPLFAAGARRARRVSAA
jgi:hypothetical protein